MESKFNYNRMKLEKISCNLCGSDNFFVLAKKSANRLPVRTCICKNCGLIYINPRMIKQDYDQYYKYFYRHDRVVAKGGSRNQNDLREGFFSARKFGAALARKLFGHINEKGLTLDVGSSTGGVLYGLKEILPKLEIMGVEPSITESEFANQQGIKTYNYLFENFLSEKDLKIKFSNILCIRSLNHLLDPKKFFLWCFENLEESGRLILEVKNFRHQVRRAGSIEAAIQIDHPYMFTPETLKSLVETAGFKVVYLDIDEYKSKIDGLKQRGDGLSRHHIRLVVRKYENNKKEKIENNYWRTRIQLLKPYLKLYYVIYYSGKLRWFRRTLSAFSRN